MTPLHALGRRTTLTVSLCALALGPMIGCAASGAGEVGSATGSGGATGGMGGQTTTTVSSGSSSSLGGSNGASTGATSTSSSSSSSSSSAGAGSGGGSGAPTLEMVSGNGGIVPSGWPAGDPLRVRARDAQGHPVANVDVTFTNTQGNAIHVQAFNGVATTDADGIALTTYNAFPIQVNSGMEVDTVTADWNGLKVDFRVIITEVPSGQMAAPPLVHIDVPDTAPDYGTAKAGSTVVAGLKLTAVVQQGVDLGQGIPLWGLRLTDPNDILKPAAVACAGGTVLSDATGHVSCDLVVPSAPGDYYFSVLAGGAIRFDAGHLHVVP